MKLNSKRIIEILDLLEEIKKKYDVWFEYSGHVDTLTVQISKKKYHMIKFYHNDYDQSESDLNNLIKVLKEFIKNDIDESKTYYHRLDYNNNILEKNSEKKLRKYRDMSKVITTNRRVL